MHYKGRPLFIMAYYGSCVRASRIEEIYGFLRKALAAGIRVNPYRGPRTFERDGFKYENVWKGTLEEFHGEETILRKGKKIYLARYLGGLVDQAKL